MYVEKKELEAAQQDVPLSEREIDTFRSSAKENDENKLVQEVAAEPSGTPVEEIKAEPEPVPPVAPKSEETGKSYRKKKQPKKELKNLIKTKEETE